MSNNSSQDSNRFQNRKTIFWINIALSLLILVISLTNLSFPGTWPNFVLPPLIGLTSLTLLSRFLLPSASKMRKRLATLSSIPAIVCGCLPPLLMLCLIIPPFTLGFFFAIDETLHEQHIQSAVSPNGTKVAEVYFRGVGAYSGGNGRITVRVRSRFFPFVEWEVFYRGQSIADEGTDDYVSWQDNKTLLISEGSQIVNANQLTFRPDPVFIIPIFLYQSLQEISEQSKENFEKTASVRSVPVYDSPEDDNYDFHEHDNNQNRHYNVNASPFSVQAWYQTELSKSPWNLEWVKSHQDHDTYQSDNFESQVIEGYCLYATKQSSDGQIESFFIEVFGDLSKPNDSHINIGTPNPITDTCSRYLE